MGTGQGSLVPEVRNLFWHLELLPPVCVPLYSPLPVPPTDSVRFVSWGICLCVFIFPGSFSNLQSCLFPLVLGLVTCLTLALSLPLGPHWIYLRSLHYCGVFPDCPFFSLPLPSQLPNPAARVQWWYLLPDERPTCHGAGTLGFGECTSTLKLEPSWGGGTGASPEGFVEVVNLLEG